jgi:hypothetical protein
MMLCIRILNTLFFSILASILFFNIPNRSNVSSFIAIPFLVSLLTKYIMGDWDTGFRWTSLDIPYWISILGASYGTVYILSKKELSF